MSDYKNDYLDLCQVLEICHLLISLLFNSKGLNTLSLRFIKLNLSDSAWFSLITHIKSLSQKM